MQMVATEFNVVKNQDILWLYSKMCWAHKEAHCWKPSLTLGKPSEVEGVTHIQSEEGNTMYTCIIYTHKIYYLVYIFYLTFFTIRLHSPLYNCINLTFIKQTIFYKIG